MDFDLLEGSLTFTHTYVVYVMAAEPMARVLKRALGKISLACGIQYCPIFLNFFCPTSVYCEEHVYTYAHISDFIQTVYELPLMPNNTGVKHFYTNFGAVPTVDWICGIKGNWCNRIVLLQTYCPLDMFRALLCPSPDAQGYTDGCGMWYIIL